MDDERLIELETRYTLQQQLLDELSDVVAQQAREIAALRRDMELLRTRVGDEAGLGPLDPDERPPHY